MPSPVFGRAGVLRPWKGSLVVEPTPQSIEAQLAVLNTKLDVLITTRDDHETRLRKIEQFKWVVVGIAAASGPAWQAISSQVN